jgi:hypothetical protein
VCLPWYIADFFRQVGFGTRLISAGREVSSLSLFVTPGAEPPPLADPSHLAGQRGGSAISGVYVAAALASSAVGIEWLYDLAFNADSEETRLAATITALNRLDGMRRPIVQKIL